MEPHELELVRRSIAMLPPGHSAGALSREVAVELIEEVLGARSGALTFRQTVASRLLAATADLEEGRRAFVERRRANWSARCPRRGCGD